jgi:hypothetical protein
MTNKEVMSVQTSTCCDYTRRHQGERDGMKSKRKDYGKKEET